MNTLSNNTKMLALLLQVVEIYGKVYISDSLLVETVLYWELNCLVVICWVGRKRQSNSILI